MRQRSAWQMRPEKATLSWEAGPRLRRCPGISPYLDPRGSHLCNPDASGLGLVNYHSRCSSDAESRTLSPPFLNCPDGRFPHSKGPTGIIAVRYSVLPLYWRLSPRASIISEIWRRRGYQRGILRTLPHRRKSKAPGSIIDGGRDVYF